jgi:molybdate transport system substrate-binding protein
MTRRARVVIVGLALALLTGCGEDTAAAPADGSPALAGTITVFAAASLTDVFTDLGRQFEAEHTDVAVQFNFAASSTLAQQITQGAPADVFASASPAAIQTVVDAGANSSEPSVFVQNTLQIVVPAGNPGKVTGLEDFADEDLIIALCAEQVPCGAASVTVFDVVGITPMPDSFEQDVRAALTKVELGEVDAALVYRTDVIAAGDAVEGIDFPESTEAINDYPIATLTEAPNPDAGAAFVAFIQSARGIAALQDAGFQPP